jgi:Spx/MgsR family transcriptional regulator
LRGAQRRGNLNHHGLLRFARNDNKDHAMTTIYGIKNCDTMKKAFKWLDENGVAYEFHDYKKSGADEVILRAAIKQHGWENVINRKGTTWRKLSDDVKASMDETAAIQTALDNPSIIKRPLLLRGNKTTLGFQAAAYQSIFK